MRITSLPAAAIALALFSACPTDVQRSNPFDPESNDPAPGTLTGMVEAPTRGSSGGIRVRLLEGPSEPSPALTDTDGSFIFTGLARGLYNVEIDEPGFQRLLIYRVEVIQGGATRLGLLTLVPLNETDEASILRGEVALEGRDLHGGVHVRTIGRPFDTHTAVDGSWQLMVPEGTYDLELGHPDYQTQIQSGVTVGRGETHVLEPVVLLAEPATIQGTAFRRTCAPDPRDEIELPAEDAVVAALGTGQTAVADDTGAFALTGLAAGVYTLRAILDGHVAEQVPGLAVRGGQVLTISEPLVLVASKGGIAGTVRASGESNHSGTIVQLTGTGFGALTAPDGTFYIDGVCAGEGYQITATRPGYVTASRGGITVIGGELTQVAEITLERQQGGFVLNGGDAFTGNPERVVSYVLTAPAGSTEMRISEDASLFDDPARTEDGWEPYLREGTLTLSPGEGTKRVLAQVRGDGAASGVLEGAVILDLIPPADPVIVIEDDSLFSNTPGGALLLTLTANELPAPGVDAVSGLAWIRLLNHDLQSGGAPPSDSDDPAWNEAPVATYARTVQHPLLRPSIDEEKEVWVRFGDRAGNWSEPVSSRVILDRKPPENLSVSIVGSAPGYANSGIVLVRFTATDENPGLTMRVANDSAFTGAVWMPFNPEITWFLTPGDGQKEVWAEFRDAAGNRTQAIHDQVTLDTEPPTGARMTIEEAPYSPAREVSLSLSAQGATEMVFSLEPDFTGAGGEHSPWLVFDPSHSIELPDADGTHTVYGKFRDAALNETVRLSATVVLDRVPPTVAGVAIAEGAYVPSPSVTVLTTAVPGERDANEMRVDIVDVASSARTSGPWGTFNPSQALTLPAPAGPKQVEVFLRDAAGNVSSPGIVQVTYDPDPPVIDSATVTITGLDRHGESTSLTRRPNVRVELTRFPDADSATPDPSGLPEMRVSENAAFSGATWQTYASSFQWVLSGQDGAKTLFVQVRDGAGNESGAASGTILLDQTPPRPGLVILDDGATYATSASVTLTFWVGGDAVEWSLDGGQTWRSCAAPICATAGPGESHVHTLPPGDGLKRVQMVFRDEAGNVSETYSDEIFLDTTPPNLTGASLSLISPTDNGFTSSVSVTVRLVHPADAAHMRVGPAASPSGCVESDMNGIIVQPVASTFTFLLPAGDGTNRVCARLLDAAGNESGFLSDTIILDTVPPTTPLIVTPSQVVSMPSGSSFVVNTAGAVSDTNFWRYEILGGLTTSWTPMSELVGTTEFTYQLLSNPSIAAGVPNVLRLRAVDRAGNVSPEASVIITVDERPPQRVTMNRLWVRNASGKATIYWQPSPSPDVVGHNIYYGTAPGDYSGLHATEGPSPVFVGNQTSAVLSGLTDGAATYVSVRPVDHAGLEGPAPTGTAEVVLWPNDVSLNLIQETSLGLGRVMHMARYGTHIYAIGTSGTCPANAPMYLRAVDISRLVSPVHGGAIQTNPPGPEVVWANEYADDLDCDSSLFGTALVIDGHWMFTVSGSRLRIFDLSVPSSPSVHATLDFDPVAFSAVAVRGRSAFLAGRNTLIALDLSKLYDGDPSTAPSVSDEIGRASGPQYPSGITWTRDRLVVLPRSGGQGHSYDISSAVDGNPGTVFDTGSRIGLHSFFGNGWGNHPASGSYAFFSNRQATLVMDLTDLWNGSPLNPLNHTIASIGQGGFCPIHLAGGQAFGSDESNRGIRGYDFTSLPTIRPVSFVESPAGQAMTSLVWGNYLFTADYSGSHLRVYEIATPRVMNPAASISGVSHYHRIEGAFLYSSNGAVVDLQSGSPPLIVGPHPSQRVSCNREVAVFDETSVTVAPTGPTNASLRVYRNERVTDRNAATNPLNGTDIYTVTFPEGTVPTGVARHGNYLVVAQAREDGIWLEVFEATPLRDPLASTVLDATWSQGAFRISEKSDGDRWAMVTMHQGRALVSIDAGFGGDPYSGLVIADLRPLLDGDASTAMTADHIQGAVDIRPVRGAVMIGEYAYAIRGENSWTGGLYVIDISAALDEDLNTKVSSTASPVLTGAGPFDAITAHGSYLLIGSRSSSFGLRSFDISNPAEPALVGQTAFGYNPPTCFSTVSYRSQISVLGSRAYVTSNDSLTIYDLQ